MTEGKLFTQRFIAQVEGQIFQLAPELATSLVNKRPGLVVALSGGSDSTALLISMSSVCQKYSWKLWVAHINHGIRGEASIADEAFCRRLCHRLNIEFACTTLKLQTTTSLVQGHCSEEKLRYARYKELEQIARHMGADYLLLGHTLDDQTETMLFNLFRGTGLTGLRGMPYRRNATATPNSISLLRPLLNIQRVDCRRFLQKLKQDWVEDSTNAEDAYTRNYIRHRVIPDIERRFPKFQDSAASLRQIVSEAMEYLQAATARAQDEVQLVLNEQQMGSLNLDKAHACEIWSTAYFNKQPPVLRKQLLAAALSRYGIVLTGKRLQNLYRLLANESDTVYGAMSGTTHSAVSATAHGAVSVAPGLRVRLQSDYIIWEFPNNPSAPSAGSQTVVFPGITPCPVFGKSLVITECQQSKGAMDMEKNRLTLASGDFFPYPLPPNEALADFSDAAFPLVIRCRQAGDIIQPLGMKEKVRLKKFIHTRKLPLTSAQRINLPVLADRQEILWVPGCGISEKIRVKNTDSAYLLNWSDIVENQKPAAVI